MKQSQKLDALIKSVLKEELDELTVPSKDGRISGVTNSKSKARAQAALRNGEVVDFVDPTKLQEKESEEETQETEINQEQSGTDIAGQVAEIVEKLKQMAEGGNDRKKQRLAEKVMKYMESAKAALEALTGHEAMLEEKDHKSKQDDATKQLRGVRKQIDKILKDKEMADRVMEKMSVDKMIDLKSKAKKDIDEAGLAKLMVKHSLKEAWILKKK